MLLYLLIYVSLLVTDDALKLDYASVILLILEFKSNKLNSLTTVAVWHTQS